MSLGQVKLLSAIAFQRDKAGKIETVNIVEAIADGKLHKLPKIYREDTIELPRTHSGLPAGDLSSQVVRKNLIYAIGAVTTPGPLEFEEDTDLLEAISMAGGPTIEANLEKVMVITKDGLYAQTLLFDMNKYIEGSSIARYVMKREDSFVIARKKTGGFLGIGVAGLASIAGLVTTAIILIDQLGQNDQVQP